MTKNPKIIKITDEKEEIKSIQLYEYNSLGDPLLFKKIDKDGKVIVHWEYLYKYGKDNEKLLMEITDIQTNKKTKMEYEY